MGNGTSADGIERSGPCDRCSRTDDLIAITTIVNGIEQKEWICSSCEPDAREDEKPPVRADGGTERFEKKHSVLKSESVGYCSIGVDWHYEPVHEYWIPVGEERFVEESYPPRDAIIQYPKEGREPSRVGDREVPDTVDNWDYRTEGDDE